MKILLVSAHPDDAEISCGGTIVRFRREHERDAVVWSVYFASCTEDPKNKGHLKDHRKACQVLGIDNLIEYDFPRDKLEEHKQDIRDKLWKIKQAFVPDVVFCPSFSDLHQDHRVVAECSLTIFRDTSSILGYEVLRSVGPEFRAHLFITLSTDDVLKKIKVIECYESQLLNRPYYFAVDRLVANMRMRGTQAKAEYAETYELLWGRI